MINNIGLHSVLFRCAGSRRVSILNVIDISGVFNMHSLQDVLITIEYWRAIMSKKKLTFCYHFIVFRTFDLREDYLGQVKVVFLNPLLYLIGMLWKSWRVPVYIKTIF